jgi:TPP-dependent pyruvate/acetoin dehydrogenase alpha subunit
MMRMKGHAIHDAAQYVPKELFEYWRARDPIARFENYLVNVKRWLTTQEHRKLVDGVESELETEREAAVASAMPDPAGDKAHQNVYCDSSCHTIEPIYGPVKAVARKGGPVPPKAGEAAVHLK